jgi:GrpB-like predicted nucleotidyltransferase (UPF0157 family)
MVSALCARTASEGTRTKGAASSMQDDLGLEPAEVRLCPHNPDWIALGARECAAVRDLLGALAVEVVHVGSTSVPGMEAKPILDVAACVPAATPVDDVVAHLTADGQYSYEGDKGDDGGLLFVRGAGSRRTAHVHVVEEHDRAWDDYRHFQRVLLDDPAAHRRYQSVKRELARQHPHDRPGYTEAKSAVIRELLDADDRSPSPHTS